MGRSWQSGPHLLRAAGRRLRDAVRMWQGPDMPFDHNDHYHRLLLRQLPRGARTALDVGCGTGRFARRLARLGIEVNTAPGPPPAPTAREAQAAGGAGSSAPGIDE